jgi:predicted MFS family arabinose efflux permease
LPPKQQIFAITIIFHNNKFQHTAATLNKRRNCMPLALWALTLSAFAIGTTEFVIVGLLPVIAADLAVSLPSAGLLVSLYALGVAVGAPLLTALSVKCHVKLY